MVRPHVGVLGLEGEFLVDLVLGPADRNSIGRKQDRSQKLFLLGTCRCTNTHTHTHTPQTSFNRVSIACIGKERDPSMFACVQRI